MTRTEALTIREQAVTLRDNLRADIPNALTRGEHIRITQLAAEAERLVAALDSLLAEPALDGFEPMHY